MLLFGLVLGDKIGVLGFIIICVICFITKQLHSNHKRQQVGEIKTIPEIQMVRSTFN